MAIVLKGGEVRIDTEGEGSRGGKIIGHTSSGKPIYDQATHPAHAGFGYAEHTEAAQAHDREEMHHKKVLNGMMKGVKKESKKMVDYHHNQASFHLQSRSRLT